MLSLIEKDMAIQSWRGQIHTQNLLYMWKCMNTLLVAYDQIITCSPMDLPTHQGQNMIIGANGITL